MRLTPYFAFATALLTSSAYAGLEDVKSSIKLTGSNFDSAISGKSSLVAFFAPWCGHCKSLAPTWEKLGQDFADEDKVLIGHLDADNADNRPTASRYGVKGYPTIKFFPADGSAPLDYNGPRSEDGFLEYINKEAGTHRTSGGLLNAMAGRLPSLDKLVTDYFSAATNTRNSLVAKAKALAAEVQGGQLDKTAASYYVRVMEKLESSSDWAAKELARLQKLASKRGSMAGKQLEDLQVRQNILQAFTAATGAAQAAASDVKGAAKSAASDVSASIDSAASQAASTASSVSKSASSAVESATDRVKAEL